MKSVRKILLPFSWLYHMVTAIRNYFYDKGIFKSYSFPVPVIAVGNLSVGGTGKTPQIEYLIRLLADDYKVATLSRGYKRSSKGFVLGSIEANANVLGDEPYQFYQKFPNIQVGVDANRKNGIENLLALSNKPEVILLDDAFQHRRVKAGFYILLTTYGDLYSDDYILPAGNLRESRAGAKRADAIIITKCPENLQEEQRKAIAGKLGIQPHQQLYFSYIEYEEAIFSEEKKINVADLKDIDKLLVAGIANPAPFFGYLQTGNEMCLTFPDHHKFTKREIKEINKQSENKIIITTEKDYVRLRGKLPKEKLFYLPIQSSFLENKNDFDTTILSYVEKSTANS